MAQLTFIPMMNFILLIIIFIILPKTAPVNPPQAKLNFIQLIVPDFNPYNNVVYVEAEKYGFKNYSNQIHVPCVYCHPNYGYYEMFLCGPEDGRNGCINAIFHETNFRYVHVTNAMFSIFAQNLTRRENNLIWKNNFTLCLIDGTAQMKKIWYERNRGKRMLNTSLYDRLKMPRKCWTIHLSPTVIDQETLKRMELAIEAKLKKYKEKKFEKYNYKQRLMKIKREEANMLKYYNSITGVTKKDDPIFKQKERDLQEKEKEFKELEKEAKEKQNEISNSKDVEEFKMKLKHEITEKKTETKIEIELNKIEPMDDSEIEKMLSFDRRRKRAGDGIIEKLKNRYPQKLNFLSKLAASDLLPIGGMEVENLIEEISKIRNVSVEEVLNTEIDKWEEIAKTEKEKYNGIAIKKMKEMEEAMISDPKIIDDNLTKMMEKQIQSFSKLTEEISKAEKTMKEKYGDYYANECKKLFEENSEEIGEHVEQIHELNIHEKGKMKENVYQEEQSGSSKRMEQHAPAETVRPEIKHVPAKTVHQEEQSGSLKKSEQPTKTVHPEIKHVPAKTVHQEEQSGSSKRMEQHAPAETVHPEIKHVPAKTVHQEEQSGSSKRMEQHAPAETVHPEIKHVPAKTVHQEEQSGSLKKSEQPTKTVRPEIEHVPTKTVHQEEQSGSLKKSEQPTKTVRPEIKHVPTKTVHQEEQSGSLKKSEQPTKTVRPEIEHVPAKTVHQEEQSGSLKKSEQPTKTVHPEIKHVPTKTVHQEEQSGSLKRMEQPTKTVRPEIKHVPTKTVHQEEQSGSLKKSEQPTKTVRPEIEHVPAKTVHQEEQSGSLKRMEQPTKTVHPEIEHESTSRTAAHQEKPQSGSSKSEIQQEEEIKPVEEKEKKEQHFGRTAEKPASYIQMVKEKAKSSAEYIGDKSAELARNTPSLLHKIKPGVDELTQRSISAGQTAIEGTKSTAEYILDKSAPAAEGIAQKVLNKSKELATNALFAADLWKQSSFSESKKSEEVEREEYAQKFKGLGFQMARERMMREHQEAGKAHSKIAEHPHQEEHKAEQK